VARAKGIQCGKTNFKSKNSSVGEKSEERDESSLGNTFNSAQKNAAKFGR
jgi:hypothetical protein